MLDRVARVEREFATVSSFMVKATSKEWLDKGYEYYYRLEHLAGQPKDLIDEGWEVGLHAGYASHDNPERLVKEKALLENALSGYRVAGVRMQYLRFTSPDTWLADEAAGVQYDTTLAFSDRPGFRNGMCYPSGLSTTLGSLTCWRSHLWSWRSRWESICASSRRRL